MTDLSPDSTAHAPWPRWRTPLVVLLLVATSAGVALGEFALARAWWLPAAGALATLAAAWISWGIGRLRPASPRPAEGSGFAAPVSHPLAVPLDLLLAAALGVVAWLAASTSNLAVAPLFLGLLAGLELMGHRYPGGLKTALAWVVGLGSPVLLRWAARLRVQSGGEAVVEWLGIPFAGDAATTLAFLALLVPLVLPPRLGGALGSLTAAGWKPTRVPLSSAVAAIARPAAYAVLLARTFAGTESLVPVGVVTAWCVTLLAAWQRDSVVRLASAAYATLWLVIAGLGVATMSSLDAFAMGLLAWCLAVFLIALIAGFLRSERAAFPGVGPDGLGRLFPVSFLVGLVALASLVGLPWLAGFHGRAWGTGALEADGQGPAALALLLAPAPLLAFIGLPWLRQVFFEPPAGANPPLAERRREPRSMLLLLAAGALALVALGILPGLAQPFLPYGDLSLTALPGPLGQAQLFCAGLLVATFFSAGTRGLGRPVSSSR